MNIQAQRPRRRGRKLTAEVAAPNPAADADDYKVKIALAAYFIAEKRGFEPGHELDDWLAAEAEIAQARPPRLTKPIQLITVESVS